MAFPTHFCVCAAYFVFCAVATWEVLRGNIASSAAHIRALMIWSVGNSLLKGEEPGAAVSVHVSGSKSGRGGRAEEAEGQLKVSRRMRCVLRCCLWPALLYRTTPRGSDRWSGTASITCTMQFTGSRRKSWWREQTRRCWTSTSVRICECVCVC